MEKGNAIRVIFVTTMILTVLNFDVVAPENWNVYYYKFSMNIINKGLSSYIPTVEDRLFVVFPNSSTQRVYIHETVPRIRRIVRDGDGNLLVELDLPDTIEPGKNITVTIIMMINITFRILPEISIESSGSFSEIPVDLMNYTVSIGAWRYEDEELRYIVDLAAQIKGDDTNVLRVISKMVEFIGNRVRYPEGEVFRDPQYPNQTLPSSEGNGKGDCDDQSALLVTMLRSIGIPSYLQTGGVISSLYGIRGETWDGHLTISSRGIGWHGWVEAYIPPWGWLPVDITYGYYYRRQDPLSPIKYSAPVRELVLESERYSTIDFVAESLKTEERIRNSSLYIHIEEEVSKKPFYNADSYSMWQPEGEIVSPTLLIMLTIAMITLVVLLRRVGSRRVSSI